LLSAKARLAPNGKIRQASSASNDILGICIGMGFFLWVKNQKSSGYVSV